MENLSFLVALMKLFHIFTLKNKRKIGLKRIICNVIYLMPLLFILVTNILYMIKYQHELDVTGLTDHVYTIALFIMFIVTYSIFSKNQVHFSEILHEIDSFIEKRMVILCLLCLELVHIAYCIFRKIAKTRFIYRSK